MRLFETALLTLLFAIGMTLSPSFAATLPECGTDVTKVLAGVNASACLHTIPDNYTFKQFCAVDECRSFLTALTSAVKTECTFNGKNIQTFISDADGCKSSTLPECSADVLQVINGTNASTCFDVIPRNYTFKQFCAAPVCRSFLTALTKVVTTDCSLNGTNVMTFIDNAQGCADSDVPVCGPEVTKVIDGAYATKCFNSIPDEYTFNDFCAVSDCRNFMLQLMSKVKTPCTVNGKNVKTFIENAQGCDGKTIDGVLDCGGDVVQAMTTPSASMCLSLMPEGYTFAQFCAVTDCRTFLTDLTAAVKKDCVVNGLSMMTFIDDAQGCRTAAPTPIGPGGDNVTTSTPASTSAIETKSGTNTTTIVVSITGAIVVIALIIAIVFLVLNKRKQDKLDQSESTSGRAYTAVSDRCTT